MNGGYVMIDCTGIDLGDLGAGPGHYLTVHSVE